MNYDTEAAESIKDAYTELQLQYSQAVEKLNCESGGAGVGNFSRSGDEMSFVGEGRFWSGCSSRPWRSALRSFS